MADEDVENLVASPTLSDFDDSFEYTSPENITEELPSVTNDSYETEGDAEKGDHRISIAQKNSDPDLEITHSLTGINEDDKSSVSENEDEQLVEPCLDKVSEDAIEDVAPAKIDIKLPTFGDKQSHGKVEREGKLKTSGSDSLESDVSTSGVTENLTHLQANKEADGTEFRHRHVNESMGSIAEVPQISELGPQSDVDMTRNSASPARQNLSAEDIENREHRDFNVKASFKNLSLFKYFMDEISRGYILELDEDKYAEKREKVYTFMKIPREVEKLMVFGFMLCLDCFLFIFTFLPIRMIVALWKLITGFFLCKKTRLLEPAQICDLLKGSIMLVSCWLLEYVDFSVLYHTVRGQSVIKLYVIYNMLEIADRLFSSFGQDILDALFWTATEPRDRKRQHIGILPHFALGVVYVFLHGVLVLFQATCLNVAVNSHNKALLVIMISNQFVELKGSVFKRFEKNNLFQMACSDIRERFHYLILVMIVALRNLTEFNWNMEHLYVIMPYLLATLSSEYFVDWVKHAFITKFNDIAPEVYREYRSRLAQDATSSRGKNAHADHFDLVSRRMGFIPLPLGSLVIRVVKHSIRIHGGGGVALVIATYFFLMSVKILNSIIFLGKASQYATEYPAQEIGPKLKTSPRPIRRTQASGLGLDSAFSSHHALDQQTDKQDPREQAEGGTNRRRAKTLAEIDRYTLCSKEIVIF